MGALKFALLDRNGWEVHLDTHSDRCADEPSRGWGEGSASALQSLQRYEQQRQSVQPRD